MLRENVEWVERFWELYNRREIDAWVGMLAPDVEWHVDPQDPDTTVHRGPEAVKRYLLYWAEMMDTTVEVREIFEASDDRAVAWTRVESRGGLSGVPAGMDLAFIFKLRDGLVVRVQETQDKRKALEAVGPRESAMSRENVEAVRRAFRAYNAGDLAALREFYEPTAVMYHLDGWPEPGPSFGRDAVLAEFARLQEAWQGGRERLAVLGDFVEISNHVLTRIRWHVSGRGPAATMEFTMISTFRKGKIITVQYFWDHAEALEAVGLSE